MPPSWPTVCARWTGLEIPDPVELNFVIEEVGGGASRPRYVQVPTNLAREEVVDLAVSRYRGGLARVAVHIHGVASAFP